MSCSSILLKYDLFGSGDNKVIVVHSWMGSSKSFDMVKKYFDTSKYTFAFVNLRGYGASKDIEGSYTSCEASGDIISLAKHLNWNEFHIVGHSMGGMISQKVLLKASKMLDLKVLSYIGVSPVTANGFPADNETQGFLKAAIHNPELSEQLVSGLTGGRLLTSWNKAVTEEYISSSNVKAMLGYFGMWVGEDFSAEIQAANIQTPLLVISGKQDLPGFQHQYYTETFGQWYSNVEYQEITDCGHFSTYETPVYLATLISAFLDKHSVSSCCGCSKQ